MKHEFAPVGPVSVVAAMRSSDLELAVRDSADHATVDVSAQGGGDIAAETRVEMDGDRLIIEVPRSVGSFFRPAGSVRVRVMVPAGSSLEAESGSGDIRTHGVLARARLKAGSADLMLDAAEDAVVVIGSGDLHMDEAGLLRATSGSGDIRLGRVVSRVEFRTGSGDIAIDSGRDIRGLTGSGDVIVDRVEGSVEVSTGSGSVMIRDAVEGEVRARAGSGDVLVGVPHGTAALLDCNSTSGRVTSGLVTGDAPGDGEKRVVLHLRTASGNIRIQRA